MTTTASTNSDRSVHRTAVIGAAPAAIFAVLTDPRTHVALDGSGTVQGVVDAPERLELGSHFRMQMKGYRTLNQVVEYLPDSLIAWRHRGRHVWRWELRPVPGGTEVTETFDYSAKRGQGVVRALGLPGKADAALVKTLDNLRARFA